MIAIVSTTKPSIIKKRLSAHPIRYAARVRRFKLLELRHKDNDRQTVDKPEHHGVRHESDEFSEF